MGHDLENTFCHKDLPLTLQVTKTAQEWAEEFGLKWETVRKRRYRGWSWTQALDPNLRRTTFNDRGLH
ncbi:MULTISPECIES: hypothetical protein [unclassified Pseudomonas]|uniref:hypothetical protein n=1 Tax=unclassified Pseudomonas TaxID=196821 RepID=UPI0024498B88|nr:MULTISPECIES: hypothetical protein [unclassified Pseudomonas]MDG9926537.1 hypothetical protein [Pseudomonas sp. GD04042]MDH0481379.1 hypothetical protein [Pseudomonas sp. GD04015]MDH0603328.1 hypothetical protein [Pseudomonas sp. GD03869]